MSTNDPLKQTPGLTAEVLETALESAGVGIWHWDIATGAVWWSRTTAQLFGEEHSGNVVDHEAYVARIHPDDRAMTSAAVEHAMAVPGAQFRVEHRILRRDGTMCWVEGRGRVERNDAGEAVRLVGTCHDITARKSVEVSLAEERRFVSTVLDTVGALVIVMGLDLRVRMFSRGCEVATGWLEEEVLGKSVVDLFATDEERERLRLVCGNLTAADFPSRFENAWLRRDGSLVRIVWSNTAILNDDGTVRFIIGTGIDVTESRRVESALVTSEERLKLALEAAGLGTWDWEVPSDRLACDDRWWAMIGYAPGEPGGNLAAWQDLVHPDDLPVVRRAVEEHLAGAHPLFEVEQRLRTKSGAYAWFLSRGRIVARDANGAPLRLAGTLLDITEKKYAEAQALRAQRLESLGMIAGGIAHDLNNTLTPTLMAVDSLRRENPNLAADELVQLIEHGALRAAALVKQVLQFARGADGLSTPIALGEIVREGYQFLRETFPKNLRISLALDEGVSAVVGDPTQLQQVLMNLCVNARDAMPAGGDLRISVKEAVIDAATSRSKPGMRPGHWVRLQVADTGSGIAARHLEHVFDPFFTTKEPGKGTGLGLPTVLAIVRRLEGFVLVDSHEGQGTVVDVYFVASEQTASGTFAAQPRLARGRGELVLLVDDEAGIRAMASRTLEANGYSVLQASDGVEAVAIFEARHRDIRAVVTDLMMPNADGASVVRAILRLTPSLPIIAMSGLPAGDHLSAAGRAGIVAFLPKPFTAEALLEAMQSALAVNVAS